MLSRPVMTWVINNRAHEGIVSRVQLWQYLLAFDNRRFQLQPDDVTPMSIVAPFLRSYAVLRLTSFLIS